MAWSRQRDDRPVMAAPEGETLSCRPAVRERIMSVASALRWRLNLYPPFLGAGVRVQRISEDFLEVDVAMRLRWFNRNYVGVHFGGSLYAMTDPFFMLMLMQCLR